MPATSWTVVRPDQARALTEARLQLHHAAQLATALGISYLQPRADDSHTNLEWRDDVGALASNPVPARSGDVRLAVRVADLTLLFDGRAFPLNGRTIADATAWLRESLATAGLDAGRFTLRRHYEIPPHAVAEGRAFDASGEHLRQLAAWYANAAALLNALRANHDGASDVRCWPHHFDIATLITVAPGRTVGAGLEPGDVYYDEPYFYVNAYPRPAADALPPTLAGAGHWHTHEWIGAVLPGSRFAGGAAEQQAQATEFLESSVRTCLELVGR